MCAQRPRSRQGRLPPAWGPLFGILTLLLTLGTTPGELDSQVPEDRIHVSLSLGGFVTFGIGVTHWLEEHHAVEATFYPFAYPWDGFPCAFKLGYAWTPSNEVWRAKLGGNLTVLLHDHAGIGRRFTPLLAFTPGLQYDPTDHQSLRWDLWMSYYITERVFAPSQLEFLYSWKN